jgi:NifU-like protein involved in Fe-S cluster formation
MSAGVLYTPEVLALATSLAGFPWDESLPLKAEARSRSCGSSIALAVGTDTSGIVRSIGLRSHACAIGQASAAIFAGAASGRSLPSLADTAGAIEAWLAGDGDLPDWPGLDAIAAARDFPGRHGAVLLPWTAARDMLSTAAAKS